MTWESREKSQIRESLLRFLEIPLNGLSLSRIWWVRAESMNFLRLRSLCWMRGCVLRPLDKQFFLGKKYCMTFSFFDWSVFMIQSEAEMDHFTWCQVPLFWGAPRSFRAAPAMPSFQRSGTASRSSFGPTCCYARVKRLVSFFDKTAGACLDSEDTVSNSIIMFGDPPLFLCLDCPLNQGLIGVWTWWFTMLGNSSERGLLLWFLVRLACFFQHLEGAWLYLQSHRLWSWLHRPMVPSASLRSVMLQSGRTNCAWIYWNFHVHVQMQRCYGSCYPIFLNYIWMYSNNINILFFWLHFVSILLNQRAFCLWAARQGGRWRARRRWS